MTMFPGGLEPILGYLVLVLWFLEVVSLLGWVGSWLPGFRFLDPGLGSLVVMEVFLWDHMVFLWDHLRT